VDDTDILHIDLTKDKSVDKILQAMQSSINSWGNCLIATGGALQQKNAFTQSSRMSGKMVSGDTQTTQLEAILA
jgi:hypothetical protein